MVKNSKILVAGGTGFIGGNLINELISLGNEVVSISKKNTNKSKNIKYICHDLTIPLKKKDILSLSDISHIVNCSGYIDHTNFKDGGKNIFNNHFQSLYTLTELAIELGVKSFIQIGSSDEYGNNKSPIKEIMTEMPISPFALGKLTSTHFLQQCFRQGSLNPVILRPFLVFGEMQKSNRFLAYLIKNCLNDKKFKVTKGEQKRDYLYIKDFNKAIIKSFNNQNAYGEVFNIASGKPITIKEIINKVQTNIGMGKPIYGAQKYREGENMELYANINKAKKILNWSPKYNLNESLDKVINWYKNNG